MSKEIISTKHAPAAIGTYSQAVKHGNQLYISGQIPLVPSTMQVIEGDFKDRTKQVFENLKQILSAANASFNDLVKLNVYLTDLNEFANVNEVMAQYIDEPYPARAAVQVAALPKGVDVEIDAIAIIE